MNKDAILATIIGFGIGLLITGSVIMGPQLAKSIPSFHMPTFSFNTPKSSPAGTQEMVSPTLSPSTSPLTLKSPTPERIETTNETMVSGTTIQNSVIVIENETSEIVITADAAGTFSQKVTLIEGKNTINVTAYIESKPYSQSIVVYYTPEEF